MLEDAIRLLKLQESYDKDLKPPSSYVGLSVNETLFRLIVDSENSKAAKFQTGFKVAEETFWNVKLRALISTRRWDELRTWSLSKKSPIGYEVLIPFSSYSSSHSSLLPLKPQNGMRCSFMFQNVSLRRIWRN